MEKNKTSIPPEKGKYAEKYKYVRFVERKKVIRKMRQLQQTILSEKPDELKKADIETKLAELRKDLLYIEKFPSKEKYMSLFPSGAEVSADCIAKRNKIRDNIFSFAVKAERRADKVAVAPVDVIKNDDFFASPEEPVPVTTKPSKPKTAHNKRDSGSLANDVPYVHPSWEAKRTNSRLTGSIAGGDFSGKRFVFSEE